MRSRALLSNARNASICWRCALSLQPPGSNRLFSRSSRKASKDAIPQLSSALHSTSNGDNVLDILEQRGLIKDIAGDRQTLARILQSKNTGAYVGIDPTAPSLHVGHLLPFMTLFWLAIHDIRTFRVLGGATVAIGDPTGRLVSRKHGSDEQTGANASRMNRQLQQLHENVMAYAEKLGYKSPGLSESKLVNNKTWLENVNIISFLQKLGSGFRIAAMMTRDTVKNKMEKGDGMSFDEFTYPLLQAWDWWHLYTKFKVKIQIGGSDQFGNIVSGIDAIKHMAKNERGEDVDQIAIRKNIHSEHEWPYGLTTPLLTTSAGEKFGKSAGNAVFLDDKLTSIQDQYLFFLRSSDEEVERYIKLFTMLPLSSIQSIMQQHSQDPQGQLAQRVLALNFVEMVHGEKAAQATMSRHLLSSRIKHPEINIWGTSPEAQLSSRPGGAPVSSPDAEILKPDVVNRNVSHLFLRAGLATSNAEAKKLLRNEGAYVAIPDPEAGTVQWEKCQSDWLLTDESPFLINKDTVMLRSGKWKVKVVRLLEAQAQGGSAQLATGKPTPVQDDEDPLSDHNALL